MMDLLEARLKIIELAKPAGVSNPSVDLWLATAGRLEAYVVGAGQPQGPAETKTAKASKARTTAE